MRATISNFRLGLIKGTANNADESRWACLNALQCPDALIVKNGLKEKDKLLDGLTNWVVQDAQYVRWQSSENVSLLWINGGPGKGKTMMTISLVEQFERLPFGVHQQRPVVTYFFCQNSDSELSSIKGVIKGLIACLLEQEAELYEPLGSRWDRREERFKEDLTSWQALWNVLVKMLNICKSPRIYVVIDALDECHEQDKCQASIECQDLDECQHTNMAMFLRKIVLVGLNSRVKWLVTSRPFHIARRELLISSDQVMINLDMNSKHISEAVKSYTAAKVLELQHRHRYGQYLRQKLEAELTTKAQDTYLWVSLVCTRLRYVKCEDVLTAVKDSPPGLTSLYGQIFDELCKGKSTIVENSMRLLKAMLTVYRPLRGEEMDSAAGLHLNDAELNKLVDRCAPLVMRRGDSIVFVHQSAQDYLRAQEAQTLSSFSSWSHSEIALSCLSCLSQRLRSNPMNLRRPDDGTRSMKVHSDTALLASMEYAATFWVQHLADAIPDVSIAKALGDHGKVIAFLSTKLLEWLECLSLLDQLPRGVEALMCLANAHHQQQQWLLDPQLNVPGPGSSLPVLLHDATRFLLRHYYTVARWPLQIYSSAILLSPQQSAVGKLNLHKTPQWLKAVHPVETTWPSFLQTFTGHELSVTSVVFSKDGKHIVSGSRDSTVKLWDATTGNCQMTLESHSDCVTTVAFLSDHEHIASGSLDKTIKLWSTTTGTCTMTLKGHSGAVNAVDFLQGTNQIASASSDTTVRLWDAATGNVHKELKGHSGDVEAVAFSPDCKHIASASSDATVKVWSLTTGKCIKTLEGHSGTVKAIAFAPNAKYIASASHDNTVKLWDATDGELLKSLEHSYYPTTVVFSPDGKSIASSSFKTVIRWNTMTGDCEKTLEGHSGRVTTVAFSPDGNYIATGSDDDTIKLWDSVVGETGEAHVQGHSQAVSTIACSPDGKHVASGSYDNNVKLWDVINGSHKTLNVPGSWFRAVAFSPDGNYLASGSSDTTIRLWNLESGSKHTLEGHTGWVVAIAFSPDGKCIASGSNDKTIKLWDLAGQCKKTLEGHTDSLTAVAFPPDGEQIASSSYDNTIKLWDIASALRPPNFLERKLTRHFKPGFNREIKTAQVVKLMQYSEDGETLFTNIGVFLVNDTAVQVATYRDLCVRDMWLCYGNLRLLRLAPDFELDCQHACGDRIAIGLRNGRVLVFDVDRAALDAGEF